RTAPTSAARATKTSTISERETGFEPATLSLGSCAGMRFPREIQAVSAPEGEPGSPWIAPGSLQSSRNRLGAVLAVTLPEVGPLALAVEVLERSEAALRAAATGDRFAAARVNEALSVAVELAKGLLARAPAF